MIEFCIVLLSMSIHSISPFAYNNVHPHVQCEQDSKIIGSYYNSESNISFYIGKQWQVRTWEIETVVATGYSSNKIQPMVRFKKNNWYIAPMYDNPKNDRGQMSSKYGVVVGYEIKISE
jgi:hypothetical protein